MTGWKILNAFGTCRKGFADSPKLWKIFRAFWKIFLLFWLIHPLLWNISRSFGRCRTPLADIAPERKIRKKPNGRVGLRLEDS